MTEEKSEDLRLDQIGNPKPIPLNAMESGRTDRDSDLGDDSPMVSCFFKFYFKGELQTIRYDLKKKCKIIFYFKYVK